MGRLLKWDPSVLLIAVVIGVGYYAMTAIDTKDERYASAGDVGHSPNCLICRLSAGDGHDAPARHDPAGLH